MRLTLQTLRLLQAFVEDPSEPRYGLELMERTGFKSGTVYPALHRLEAEGWLRSFNEAVDSSAVGRPARRLYELTVTGQAGATEALRALQVPVPARPSVKPRARFA